MFLGTSTWQLQGSHDLTFANTRWHKYCIHYFNFYWRFVVRFERWDLNIKSYVFKVCEIMFSISLLNYLWGLLMKLLRMKKSLQTLDKWVKFIFVQFSSYLCSFSSVFPQLFVPIKNFPLWSQWVVIYIPTRLAYFTFQPCKRYRTTGWKECEKCLFIIPYYNRYT